MTARTFVGGGALVLLFLGPGACGPKRLPSDLLQRLPYETRIELLEAENDLAIAIDKRDEAENEVSRTRDALRRAKARLSDAEDEEGAAKDPVSREVATLAVQEAEARVAYLRARQEVNVEALDTEEVAFDCARDKFELARLNAARKGKVQGSESFSPKDFEADVARCEAALARERGRLKEKDQRAKAAREEWEKKKAQLAKKTFDARASPYVE